MAGSDEFKKSLSMANEGGSTTSQYSVENLDKKIASRTASNAQASGQSFPASGRYGDPSRGPERETIISRKDGTRDGVSHAQRAIDAAQKNEAVNFKDLDQRIADRPLYMESKATISHSELFGDTWSWKNPPKWNSERFKPDSDNDD